MDKGRSGILALREIIGSQIMSFFFGHFKDVDFHSGEEKGNVPQFPAGLLHWKYIEKAGQTQ